MIENDTPVAAALERLGLRSGEGLSTLELLRSYQEQAEGSAASLENPRAVFEYIAFFLDLITRTISECERIAAALRQGITPADIAALRQIASDAAAEQRRCLVFRDQCINRPLPDERLRPLLNEISVTTRDQLTAFRDLGTVASTLEKAMAPTATQADDQKGFDRRALFTKFFNRER